MLLFLYLTPHNLLNNIRLLSDSERTSFQKFLRSPFYNQQPELLRLYRLLIESFPFFFQLSFEDQSPKNIPSLLVEGVFQEIYPDEVLQKTLAQQKTKVYNLCSDLNLAFEKFIAAQQQKKDRMHRYRAYMEFLQHKNNETLWRIALRKFRKAIEAEKDSLQKRHYLYLYHKMEFESSFFDCTNKKYATAKLELVFNSQNDFRLLTRIAQACEFVYRAQIIQENNTGNFNDQYLQSLLREVKPAVGPKNPLLHCYYAIVLLKVADGELKDFTTTATLIKKYFSQIAKQELNELVRYLLNFCTHKSNQGNKDFLESRLHLEKWAVESGILLEDGLVPDGVFLNAGLNAIGLGRFDLAQDYIRQYGEKLDREVQVSAISLVRSYLYFFQKKYKQALEELDMVTLQRHNYSIRKYLLLVRVMYHLFLNERNMVDGDKMHLVLDNFKKFCLRNNYHIPSSRKKGYLNLERLMRKMVDFHFDPYKNNQRQLRKIEKDLQRQPLALRPWAEARVHDLLKKGSDATG